MAHMSIMLSILHFLDGGSHKAGGESRIWKSWFVGSLCLCGLLVAL